MRTLRLLVLSWLLITLTSLQAQILEPVHWSGQPQGDSVVLTATIDSGWHMTLISVGDSMIGEDCASGFTLTVTPTTPIRFVSCDDQQCLSPVIYTYADAPSDLSHVSGAPLTPSTSHPRSLIVIFLLGLLGGFLAIFTPCVWPIIPMTVSFFMKRRGGIRDAVGYGLAIIIIYVGLGLAVTLIFGASALNTLATNAIVNLFFFALLVVFSLSFFGLFEITLPDSWSTRMDNRARQTSGFGSIVLMAFTLVIVSFSCTGPIIGTLLVEAASRSLMAPAMGMLGFALALALPFALFALFPNWLQQLPKSGQWMQSFKVTLAFIELALSLKFLSVADMAYGWGILPRWLFIAVWVICFLALGFYLIRKSWVGKMVAIASWLFAAYLIPGLWGAPVRAIAAFAPPMPASDGIFYDYEQGMAYARAHRQPVLLDFTGYGCVNCRKMEQWVLSDPQVQQRLQSYVIIELYVDSRQDLNHNQIEDGSEYSRLQRERFASNAQPMLVQLSPDNQQPIGLPQAFTTEVDEFLNWLQY